MNKRALKVVVVGLGAAFVLTACAVSTRQIVTSPTLNLSPAQEAVLPAAAEERTALPVAALARAAQSVDLTAPTKDAAKAQAKSAEQVKTAEQAADAEKGHGCAGYDD